MLPWSQPSREETTFDAPDRLLLLSVALESVILVEIVWSNRMVSFPLKSKFAVFLLLHQKALYYSVISLYYSKLIFSFTLDVV